MPEQFTRFDTADYLKNSEAMAAYLDACFEEDPGDGSLVHTALNDIERAQGMVGQNGPHHSSRPGQCHRRF